MKFFDLELGGLGAARVTYDDEVHNDNLCWYVEYTNGSTIDECKGTGEGPTSLFCRGVNPDCKVLTPTGTSALRRIRR